MCIFYYNSRQIFTFGLDHQSDQSDITSNQQNVGEDYKWSEEAIGPTEFPVQVKFKIK
jgi:hypothetical protein